MRKEDYSQDPQDYRINGKGAFMGVHDAHYEPSMPNTHNTSANMVHGLLHLAHSTGHVTYVPKMTKSDFLNANIRFIVAFQTRFKEKHKHLIQYNALEEACKMFVERMEDIYAKY